MSPQTPNSPAEGPSADSARPGNGEIASLAAENAALVRLHEISTRLVGQEDLATLLQAVMEAAITVSNAPLGTLQIYDQRTRSLYLAAQRGFPPGLLEGFGPICHTAQTTCGEVLRRGERVVVEDFSQRPGFMSEEARLTFEAVGVHAAQATPLKARSGLLLGVMATFWKAPHHPDAGTLRVLDLLARQAADLIEHRRREEALAMELATTRKLQEISLQLIREDKVEALYEQIIGAAADLMRSDIASMQTFCAERGASGQLLLLAHRGFAPDAAETFKWVGPDSDCACGVALRAGCRVIFEDVEDCQSIISPALLDIYRKAGVRAVQSTPLRARNGRLMGMLSTHWREPHRPTERDLRLLDVLARQAADLLERSEAEAALRAAARRKDEFLAILAHELRNPLAPLRNALEVLRLSGHDAAMAERVGAMMERQVDHLVRLVDDLIDVSRITRGQIVLKKEVVDLLAIVRSAVETSQPLIDAGQHRLTISIPPGPVLLDADPTRLTQVFANLLNNAAKYTEPGGQIAIVAQLRDEAVCVCVRDSGVGISEECLQRVFDLFARGDPRSDGLQGGLGIGLALARKLVQLHGGRLEAHSAGPGKGSEFSVLLPLSGAGVAAAPAQAPPLLIGVPHRVLVVDDNRDAADSLGMLLGVLGAQVEVVYDGPAALAALDTFRPTVVLLDLGMPGMDGYEVARQIRQRPEFRETALVALTGWGQEEDRRRTQAAEFDDHLTKPVGINMLQTLFAALRARGQGTA